MKPRQKKLLAVLAGLVVLGGASALVLNAFNENIVFYYTPTQVAAKEAPLSRTFRMGGLVEDGSLKREADGLTVRFIVTDTAMRIPVTYTGVLPDLFREGQGVVAQGRLQSDGTFHAEQVLAKHDENYMPPEAAEALEKAHKAQKAQQQGGGAQ